MSIIDLYDPRRCNTNGPDGYHCTESVDFDHGKKIAHGGPHVARAIVGTNATTEIVRWSEAASPTWNPGYRGR